MQLYGNKYGDLRSVQKTRKATKHMKPFGKVWNPGDKIRCYLPLMIDGDVVSPISAGEWVHRIDAKALKLGGMYSAISQAPRDPDTGKPIARDLLAKLASISRELLRIEKEAEIRKIANNTRLKEENRATAIKEKEKEYENKSPLIGPARITNILEMVAVPLSSSGTPEMTKADACYMDVSEKRGDALLKILDSTRYHVDLENKLLEVEYVMGASGDRKVDAKVSPDGILEKEAIQNAFPECFAELQSGPLGVLPESPEVIYKRNPAFREADSRKLLNAFSQYLSLNGEILDLMEQDEDGVKVLKSAADLLDDMSVQINAFDVAEEARKIRAEAAGEDEKPELVEHPEEALDEEIARDIDAAESAPASEAVPMSTSDDISVAASSAATEATEPIMPDMSSAGEPAYSGATTAAPSMEDLGL